MHTKRRQTRNTDKASKVQSSRGQTRTANPQADASDGYPARTWIIMFVLVVAVVLGLLGSGRDALPTLISWLHRPSQSTITQVDIEPPFAVVDFPGRGKGLMATRDIKQGELLIREQPLFLIHQQITVSPTTLLGDILNALSSEDRQRFYNLSFVHLDPALHSDKLQVALATVQTNAVSAGPGHIGVFPTMARLNHACAGAFNSVYSWRDKEGVLVVHALKCIKKGQELLTTYTDSKRNRDHRQDYLSGQYAFDCACAVCSLPPSESEESDRRLETMAYLYSKFASWGAGSIDGREAADIARAIWKLGDEEGYWSERGRLAGDVVWVAAAQSDAVSLRQWAKLAVEWYGYEIGADSEQVREMDGHIARPEKHPAWGTRTGTDIGGIPNIIISR